MFTTAQQVQGQIDTDGQLKKAYCEGGSKVKAGNPSNKPQPVLLKPMKGHNHGECVQQEKCQAKQSYTREGFLAELSSPGSWNLLH